MIARLLALFGYRQKRPNGLLLDECVTSRLILNVSKEIAANIEHSRFVECLGKGASDDKILKYAKSTGQTLITADRQLIRKCLRKNVKVGDYRNGTVYIMSKDSDTPVSVVVLGKHIKRLPRGPCCYLKTHASIQHVISR